MFRVTITMPDGSKGRHTAPFEDGVEAALQTMADFPEAKRLSVIYVGALSLVDRRKNNHEQY